MKLPPNKSCFCFAVFPKSLFMCKFDLVIILEFVQFLQYLLSDKTSTVSQRL